MYLIKDVTVQDGQVVAHIFAKLLRLVTGRVRRLTSPLHNELQLVENETILCSCNLRHCNS